MSATLTGITVDDLTSGVPEPIDGLPEFVWVYFIPSEGVHAIYDSKQPEDWLVASVEPSPHITTLQGSATTVYRVTPNDALQIARKEECVGVAVSERANWGSPVIAEIRL